MGMHLSQLDGITSPLKQQRNTSSNNPVSPALISLQLPIPLPVIPLSLTAGDSNMLPILVPPPAMVQPNTSATVPLFVNLSDDQTIQTLFATTFPNCVYTKATFYKHHTAYRAAIEHLSDRVEFAVDAGYSPAGQWNTLLAEIKANALSLTPTLPPSLPMDPSTADTGLLLPTDLTSEIFNPIYSFHGQLILVFKSYPASESTNGPIYCRHWIPTPY
ncbi:uncharacterized protein EDB93DRAFT_1247406 [Suillus bovinus]|uniref:uncharacterized protein n=1 Tax=Suillus bovinus TaxID=48563 RepID=UPI001B85E6B9|nr:uncharacterized protein EDB93DRAFT_1247406 [Suillus bovinus]KAG2156705.1 hypothetical protein EDB93DRAFT_1247406 [Suillus bovinus]